MVASMNATRNGSPAIDFHAHVLVAEVYAVTQQHSIFAKSVREAGPSEQAKRAAQERADRVVAEMCDLKDRPARMDQMGVDIQVLSSSNVHQCTYAMPVAESLKLEQAINDHCARAVADGRGRYVGLGSVPLQDGKLAAQELVRVMRELGLKGVTISTTAGEMELGEKPLWPFWEKAEELGAAIYIHPAGNHGPRFQKWMLWNCVGQCFEEAMAVSSLMYEGVLEAFPRLKICISHGGGYMPYNLGRVARNYLEKPPTRINMKKSPAEYMRMLYYDTCVYDPVLLRNLVEQVGASQVVLGSDYPVGEMKPIEFVQNTPGLSDADKARIIGGNAAELLGIGVPA